MSTPTTILLFLRRVDCIDGVAAYLETLTAGLTARGDKVVIASGPVTTPDGSVRRRDAIRASVLDWLVIDDLNIRTPLPGQIKQIVALIRKHRVKVIGPQGFSVLPYCWILSLFCGRKMIAIYHPSVHAQAARDIPTRRPLKARLGYRLICNAFAATRFIAASKENEAFYRDDCGIPMRRIHYQVMGIDSDTYRAPSDQERADSRAAFGFTDNTLVCVLSGRLNLVKGHDVAVDAVRQLRREQPGLRIKCLFAGAGSQRDEIEAYAHRDDADRETFVFLGFINQPERVRAVYWAADILLLPSRFEGSPLVIPEAMCCGAVPIRTPTGGWTDQFVDRESGFIIPFNDAPALADRILLLSDRERLGKMRQSAIAFASAKFSKKAMIDGTSDLFRSVAAGEPASCA